jgi:general secretion pathway protein I
MQWPNPPVIFLCWRISVQKRKRHLSHFRRSRAQAGFGLLEVLVSLVIFASVGFTLLAWFAQSVDSVQRLKGFYDVQDARRTALEFARTLNPMRQPKGELAHGSLRLEWQAVAQGDELAQTGYPAGVGRYRLRLYDTTLSVFRGEDVEPWFVEKLSLIGHRFEGAPSASR